MSVRKFKVWFGLKKMAELSEEEFEELMAAQNVPDSLETRRLSELATNLPRRGYAFYLEVDVCRSRFSNTKLHARSIRVTSPPDKVRWGQI